MPNWCFNSLRVNGPERVRAEWLRILLASEGSDVGLLGTFVKPAYDEAADNWYSAHLAAWGTKWDVHLKDVEIDEDDEWYVLRFESAWSPPCDWLVTMSGDWPSLEFGMSFDEGGMGFMGYIMAHNGLYWESEGNMPDVEISADELEQERLDEAYYVKLEQERERLFCEVMDAYDRGME